MQWWPTTTAVAGVSAIAVARLKVCGGKLSRTEVNLNLKAGAGFLAVLPLIRCQPLRHQLAAGVPTTPSCWMLHQKLLHRQLHRCLFRHCQACRGQARQPIRGYQAQAGIATTATRKLATVVRSCSFLPTHGYQGRTGIAMMGSERSKTNA